ncbi:MAG: L-2-hydroxyglutarate oxidase [Planctomycetaceae bacterium]|nr:L-2-hydroxyglutarate oxidase [Planctomycetaceae bacterium]MCB9951946.1 L-2-hydroxyglutarate oxidase [Planctomycetaceae bacterium]
MLHCDVAIIGGGIVGLATAWRLTQRHPDLSVFVFEKEDRIAAHQTGRNSGVLHSGIYYRPGTLRATNCRTGKLAMEEFCRQEDVPFDMCGKVIVAVNEEESGRLDGIYERGQQNGVKCELIDETRLKELEPHTAGIRAIHVPEAGIVDYPAVCDRLAKRFQEGSGRLFLKAALTGIKSERGGVVLNTKVGDCKAKYVVTCGGLQADRLISLSGIQPEAPIVPFRGEFFTLRPEAEHLCRTLIYPVPDPRFPFLGVHFTKLIHGGVECGPNAVLAMAREGYGKFDVSFRDLAAALTYSGFLRLAAANWSAGLGEMWRSWNKSAFVRALQRLVPAIKSEDLTPAPCGIRAQALGRDGKLLDDFVFQETERIVHVGNAPSPAATAALNIGDLIVDRLDKRLSS